MFLDVCIIHSFYSQLKQNTTVMHESFQVAVQSHDEVVTATKQPSYRLCTYKPSNCLWGYYQMY